MKALKELIEEQKWNGMSDLQVIISFLDINNMEEEAMDLINELAKTKIEKLKYKERIVKEWTSWLPSKFLYENYDLDTADMLHTLELDYLSNGCELSSSRLKWAEKIFLILKSHKCILDFLLSGWMKKVLDLKGKTQ